MKREDNFGGAIGGRWEPGVSGNPNGRPPDSLTTLLKEYLQQGDNKANKEKIVESLTELATSPGAQGQIAALKEIFDRIDGKVKSSTDINIEGLEVLGTGVVVELFKALSERQKELDEARIKLKEGDDGQEGTD